MGATQNILRKLKHALKIELYTSTDHKIVPGDRHTQSEKIASFLRLERKTAMMEINMNDQQHFSEDSEGKKKNIETQNSVHKNLQSSHNN